MIYVCKIEMRKKNHDLCMYDVAEVKKRGLYMQDRDEVKNHDLCM